MATVDLRDALAVLFRKHLSPFAATLISQYQNQVEYDITDFPLEPEQFERFRRRVVSGLVGALGDARWHVPQPSSKESPIADLFVVETLGRFQHEGVLLDAKIIGNRFSGDRFPAILCVPEGTTPLPAVAVFSGHSDHGLRDLVLDPESYQRALAFQLAQAGFVALAVEKIDSGYLSREFQAGQEGGDDENAVATFLLAWGAPSVAARQVMASLCALEHLALHPRVDESRIGATGVSFGGWSALYAALLSDRVAAVADFGRKTQLVDLELRSFQGVQDYSHLFPGLARLGQRNILPLALAPRPLFVGHGRADTESDRQSSLLFRNPLIEQYRVLGAETHLHYHEHLEGDVMPAAQVIDFFKRVLAAER